MPAVLLEASIQEDFNVILEVVEVTIAGTIFLLILASFISTNWQNNSVNCISTVSLCQKSRSHRCYSSVELSPHFS